jgi:hypothetical protein
MRLRGDDLPPGLYGKCAGLSGVENKRGSPCAGSFRTTGKKAGTGYRHKQRGLDPHGATSQGRTATAARARPEGAWPFQLHKIAQHALRADAQPVHHLARTGDKVLGALQHHRSFFSPSKVRQAHLRAARIRRGAGPSNPRNPQEGFILAEFTSTGKRSYETAPSCIWVSRRG